MPSKPRPLQQSQMCIIGLGLMGGSLGMALRGHVGSLSAVDRDKSVCTLAIERQIISRAGDDLTLAEEADIVVLATPVRSIIDLISALGSRLRPGAMVIDLGSVKTPIVEAMNRLPHTLQAIGGHPMCGKAVSGLAHAEPDLFHNAAFVLCPTRMTSADCLNTAREIVSAVDARAIEMDCIQHDQIVATVSGLPYALAAALAYTAGQRAQADPAVWSLAASGFRDTSRLAGTDPVIMADILLANAPAILAEMESAQATLAGLAELVRAGDPGRLQVFLRQVQAYRRAWESEAARA